MTMRLKEAVDEMCSDDAAATDDDSFLHNFHDDLSLVTVTIISQSRVVVFGAGAVGAGDFCRRAGRLDGGTKRHRNCHSRCDTGLGFGSRCGWQWICLIDRYAVRRATPVFIAFLPAAKRGTE